MDGLMDGCVCVWQVLAEGWERMNDREDALRRGVKIWHMHRLEPSIEQIPLRRGRLLAAHATTIGHIDMKEAAATMQSAVKLAPSDSVSLRVSHLVAIRCIHLFRHAHKRRIIKQNRPTIHPSIDGCRHN